ncbi:MAG: GGDEF domain-containing protein [Oligoflexia bacterium]|nr:GGDEF domain-containing protein [Oligoflexia bacterium]
MSEILENFLTFVIQYDPFSGPKRLYGQLDRFLKNNCSSMPLLVLSLPLKHSTLKKDPLKYARAIWNKGHAQRSYSDNNINTLLKEYLSKGEKEKYHCLSLDDKEYCAFYCGKSETQLFVAIFKSKEKPEVDFLQRLTSFMENSNKCFLQLRDYKKLEDLVHIDDVTGLYNQRKLYKDLDSAVLRYKEMKEPFSVLFIDIDHFKSVNDGHGHLVGTQLLNDMASLLKLTLRESDLIYRYGGDEFVMIIPDVNSEIAEKIGHRILKAVKNEKFVVDDESSLEAESNDFALSVSIGIAAFPDDANTKEDVLLIADKMMYEAKKKGRGRVCFTSEIFQEAK